MSLSEEARKLLPPSPREGDREAVVGVAEVGNIYKCECICEGTSSQDAILQSGLSYLRHYRPAVGISDL